MIYSPVVLVHICGGIAGLVAGCVALYVRKGSPVHRKSGDAFVVAMIVMALSGGYVAVVKGQGLNMFAAVLMIYLVTTGWLTLTRTSARTMRANWCLLFVALGAAAMALFVVPGATARGPWGPAYAIFAAVNLLLAAGDVRMLIGSALSRAQRLARHVWRMGFALFITAGSFFLGSSSDPVMRRSGLRATLFNDAVRKTHLPAVPVIIIVVTTLFWLVRVRFARPKINRAVVAAPRHTSPVRDIAA